MNTQPQFADRSQELQRLLMSAGYRRHDGVSTAGIKLISRLARGAKIRDWPDTETIADYDALIAVLRRHLGLSPNTAGVVTAPQTPQHEGR